MNRVHFVNDVRFSNLFSFIHLWILWSDMQHIIVKRTNNILKMYDIITYIEKCRNNSEQYAIVGSTKEGNSYEKCAMLSLALKNIRV